MKVEGSPLIMRREESGWTDCTEDMLVDSGDVVKTRKDESVSLSFTSDDSNIVKIEEKSDVIIKRSVQPHSIELIRGEVFSVIRRLPPNSTFEVITPTAVSCARGTEWRTSTDGKKTTFSVFDKEIYTRSIDASGKLMAGESVIKSGWSVSVPKFAEPLPPVKIPKEEMARWDSQKAAIFKKIEKRDIKRPEIQKKVKELKEIKKLQIPGAGRAAQLKPVSKTGLINLKDKSIQAGQKAARYKVPATTSSKSGLSSSSVQSMLKGLGAPSKKSDSATQLPASIFKKESSQSSQSTVNKLQQDSLKKSVTSKSSGLLKKLK